MSERKYNRILGVLRLAALFAVILVLIYYARPTVLSVAIGFVFVVLGETVRFWSSGLLLKTRELMTAGPYRYTRNPQRFPQRQMPVHSPCPNQLLAPEHSRPAPRPGPDNFKRFVRIIAVGKCVNRFLDPCHIVVLT